MASNGSAVVEQLTHDPKFEGSNTAYAGTTIEKIAQNYLPQLQITIVQMFITSSLFIASSYSFAGLLHNTFYCAIFDC